jgi:AAA15 family ATPase/GTPase
MKIASEDKMRAEIRKMARQYGCQKELEELFTKYDRMLTTCRNQKEKEAIGVLGVTEVHKLFDFYSKLVVNGQLILDGEDEEFSSRIKYLGS